MKTIEELVDAFGDTRCEGCLYHVEHIEVHPYGSTTASETLWECSSPRDEDCPALKEINHEK